jgi:hypothetical protein
MQSTSTFLQLQCQILSLSAHLQAEGKTTEGEESWNGIQYWVKREGGTIVDRERLDALPLKPPTATAQPLKLSPAQSVSQVLTPAVKFFQEPSVLRGLPGELLWDGLERFGRLTQLDPSEITQITDLFKVVGEKGGIPGKLVGALGTLGLITADYLLHLVVAIPIVAAREIRKTTTLAAFNTNQELKKLQPKVEKSGTVNTNGSSLGKVLAENNISFEDISSTAKRLEDMSAVKTSHEAINRRQSLIEFFDRLKELEALANLDDDVLTHGGTTQGKDWDKSHDIQCRIMALKAEIKNGELLDEFLKGDRSDEARKAFVDQVSSRETLSGEPKNGPQSIQMRKLSQSQQEVLRSRIEPFAISPFPKVPPETRYQYDQAVDDLGKLLPIPLDVNVGIVGAAIGPFALAAPTSLSSDPQEKAQQDAIYKGTKVDVKDGLINLGQWDLDPDTALIHEAGHIYEAKSGLTPVTAAYIRARSVDNRASLLNYKKGVDAPTYDLRKKFQGSGPAVKDTDLSIPYAGKIYINSKGEQTNSEIISVGIESLETPDALQSIGVNDREHLMFTLGCLDKNVAANSQQEMHQLHSSTR